MSGYKSHSEICGADTCSLLARGASANEERKGGGGNYAIIFAMNAFYGMFGHHGGLVKSYLVGFAGRKGGNAG